MAFISGADPKGLMLEFTWIESLLAVQQRPLSSTTPAYNITFHTSVNLLNSLGLDLEEFNILIGVKVGPNVPFSITDLIWLI